MNEGFGSTIIVTFFTSDLCPTVECANGKNKYGRCGNCDWSVAAFRLATRWTQILLRFFPKDGPDCAAKFEAFNSSYPDESSQHRHTFFSSAFALLSM